ncbi:endonuclease [Photobacterium frigidiphilum]|uniref:Endonuclease n=1 Tax=Photobacterium frigidiphilum TaxID=264736 RepID=A0A2T3JAA2_9GAMM|nr:Hok/Gef family protein [Photobacterium frigidiphilum]PSU45714.1 endonuclease [Photobacterium frigidiphilum]
MQKKSLTVTGLLVVCITIVVLVALVRDTLCSVNYQDGKQVLFVTLAYESKQ